MGESWDSPHNLGALPEFGTQIHFSCPAEVRRGPAPFPFTSYLMLVRSPASSAEKRSAPASSLPPDAVLIVESADCGIKFAEPRDLPWETLWEGASPFGKGKLNSFHPRVVKALRGDGKVIDIPKSIDKQDLQKLLMGTSR